MLQTLQPAYRTHVTFDPTNAEHLEAFNMLCLGTYDQKKNVMVIANHPTLRFKLEVPYTDVRTMMFHKVGQKFMEIIHGVKPAA